MFQNQISSLSNFQSIQLESDITVITLLDNLTHTYCSKIKWEKNSYTPMGFGQLIMPYSEQIASYWMKYSGAVIIHANLNSKPQSFTRAMALDLPYTPSLNLRTYLESQEEAEDEETPNATNSDKKTKTKKSNKIKAKKTDKITNKDKKVNKLHVKNDEYNYSFIGKVTRFKQTGKTFIVYLEDLGWKFLQKVPKEFRDAYIAGQSLDDAFQAMCEFMGVEFAYSIEDLSQYNFSADGYSIEKDGKVIEDVSTVLSEWAAPKEDEEEEEKSPEDAMGTAMNNEHFESDGLQEYNKQQQQSNNQSSNQSSNQAINSAVTNSTNPTDPNAQQQQQEEEKTQTPAEKIEQYQEEFDEKIKDLFIGNTLYDSNISDPILNYDWITITPKAPEPATTTTTTDTTTNPNDPNNTNNSNDPNSQNNQNNNNQNNNNQTTN